VQSARKLVRRRHDSRVLARRALQVQRGAARAAVLGVNDGLVSVLCLVLAVAGAGASASAVLLAGLAGWLAGAISMAAGEWISVRAQVELFQGILKDVDELVRDGDQKLLGERLAEHLCEAGYSRQTAELAVQEITASDQGLTSAYARQVMGFNPDELGSPWVAAGSSFLLFTVGALAPLAAWFFVSGTIAITFSIALTCLAGLATGGYIAASSGKSIAYGALRQLMIVILAAAITYGLGYLFGVNVG
jgi:VIT1/CCC1 family predicted Fe2+/Mn2+ transporter